MLGALGRVGRGFGSAKRGLGPCWARCVGFGSGGRAWGLAVLGALGRVGRGVWLWWARWAFVFHVGFYRHCTYQAAPRTLTHLGDFSLDIA